MSHKKKRQRYGWWGGFGYLSHQFLFNEPKPDDETPNKDVDTSAVATRSGLSDDSGVAATTGASVGGGISQGATA